MRKIRTTIRPDEVLEVDESEFLDLSRQGLVKKDETPKKEREGTADGPRSN